MTHQQGLSSSSRSILSVVAVVLVAIVSTLSGSVPAASAAGKGCASGYTVQNVSLIENDDPAYRAAVAADKNDNDLVCRKGGDFIDDGEPAPSSCSPSPPSESINTSKHG